MYCVRLAVGNDWDYSVDRRRKTKARQMDNKRTKTYRFPPALIDQIVALAEQENKTETIVVTAILEAAFKALEAGESFEDLLARIQGVSHSIPTPNSIPGLEDFVRQLIRQELGKTPA